MAQIDENVTGGTGTLNAKLARTRLLIMDVDGVLTDGTFGYDGDGIEQKRFHVGDGLGLVILGHAGIDVAWLSGRASAAVERRGAELGVAHVIQGIRDKGAAVRRLAAQNALEPEEIAYIGDDWNDLLAYEAVGVRIAVSNAARELQEAADMVTDRCGGHGAVREVCEAILDARNIRTYCLNAYLAALSATDPGGVTGQ